MSALRIGDWIIHVELDRIERDGAVRDVPHQVMALLSCLAAHAGEVVTKERLIEEVWDGGFTTDEVISTAVYELRRALGDDARKPRYIETIRKRGYRLVEPVLEWTMETAPRRSRAWHRIAWVPAVVGLVAVAVALGVRLETTDSSPVGEPEASATALAELKRPISTEACDAYLKGQHFLDLGTKTGLQKAVQFFTEAARIQSDLGMAYTGLAQCYTTGDWGLLGLTWREAFEAADRAARRALEIDGETPTVQAALASIRFRYAWDWSGAESFFRASMKEDGCGSPNREAYAEYLSAMGRHDEAIELLCPTGPVSSLSLRANWTLAWSLYLARRYEECVRHLEGALELYPNEALLHELLGDAFLLSGDGEKAVRAYERAVLLSSGSVHRAPDLARLFETADAERALAWRTERASNRVRKDGASPYELARLQALRGHPTAALAALRQALEERRSDLVWVNVDPAFDAMRRNPDFRNLIARLNLPA